MNLALIQGAVHGALTVREVGGGLTVSFDVRVEADSHPLGVSMVPVLMVGQRAAPNLADGDAVTVVGAVRRRFFRSGGTTQSRTEVVASTAVRGAKSGQRAIERALAAASP
jgi:single-strand DNA-binding protein